MSWLKNVSEVVNGTLGSRVTNLDVSVGLFLRRMDIMAVTIQQVLDDVAAEKVEVAKAVKDLKDQLAAIPAGTVVTQAQLDALDAAVKDIFTPESAVPVVPPVSTI